MGFSFSLTSKKVLRMERVNNKKHWLVFIFLFILNAFNADSQISSATFGMMEARWLGPGTMSGRISAIEGVNEDGKTIYVGTAGGGIWKTTNACLLYTSDAADERSS